jgi:hypothetical protein
MVPALIMATEMAGQFIIRDAVHTRERLKASRVAAFAVL